MKKFFVFVFCIFIAFSSVGCKSTEVVTEFVVPDLNFPSWPNPGLENFPFDDGTNSVIVPLDYWEKLLFFKKDVKALEEYYKKVKELYMGADE